MDFHGEKKCGRAITMRLKYCQAVLKVMYNKKHQTYAWPFYYPVDAEMLGLSDYREIIKTPMDLGTVKEKLESGEYTSPDDFAADVRLINCCKYNPPEHELVKKGRKLEEVFEMEFAKIPEGPLPKKSAPRMKTGSSDSSSSESEESESSEDTDSESERSSQLNKLQGQAWTS